MNDVKNKCLYWHYRNDDLTVFYVGIGLLKRADSKSGRNVSWHEIVKTVGYSVKVIHQDLSIEESQFLEKWYIKSFGRLDKNEGLLVNQTDGGATSKGFKHSDEAKAKISAGLRTAEYHQNRPPVTEETRMKMRLAKLGRKQSAEMVANRVKKITGLKRTEETKRKLSEANKGQVPWCKGKKITLSEERKIQLKEIGARRKGIPLSEEHCRNIGKAHLGMKRPEGTGEKIAATKRGKPRSPETIQKISQTRLQTKLAKQNNERNNLQSE